MKNQIENSLQELLHHLGQGDILKAIDWKIRLNELLDQEISGIRARALVRKSLKK